MEKFNKNDDQDLEREVPKKETPENLEEQEGDVINQDPDYGVLSDSKAFEVRKHLFELVEEAKIAKEKKIIKIY